VFGQLFADVTGLPVKVPRHKEVTARGGALLALVGLGLFESYADACREPELEATYLPNDELLPGKIPSLQCAVFCAI
jgi:L-xylulokinase